MIIVLFSCTKTNKKVDITRPKLTNNPSWDDVCTNRKPLLSFYISRGGIGKRTYIVNLDTEPEFNSPNFIEYKNIEELDEFIVQKRVEKPLVDKIRYYFRAKAVDSEGNESKWAYTRFSLDTDYNKKFMNLTRAKVQSVKVSTGENPKNLIDYDDPGQVSFWQAAPPGPIKPWAIFDLGKPTTISRIWMLANINTDDGWLVDFVWEKSLDGQNFEEIIDAKVPNNDTFRNVIDIEPVSTRYLRLKINHFRGVAPHLNCVIFYMPGKPQVPIPPRGKYVLLVGDQMNGGTFTQLAPYIETLDLGLQTLTVPHYEISLDMLNRLQNKPVAIILSGNNADYPHLPMYEFNGVYEIIRNTNIPLLGICAGHQMLAFTYGYSFVRSMGWEALTALEVPQQIKPIRILIDDPIFKGMKNPFIAPEIHGWAIAVVPKDFELLAASTYIQSIKHKDKFIYGSQFHPEVEVSYNEGKKFLINFLKMALKNS